MSNPIVAGGTTAAPCWIVPSDDKKAARVDCISHILASIPYERAPFTPPDLGRRKKRPEDHEEDPTPRRVVPGVF